MRAWLAALVFSLGAGGAQAQVGVPFAPYEPTPAYLGLGNNAMNCEAAPAPYPYNRDARRGQQAGEPAPPPSGCPPR
jgi:hypothetical protein